MYAELALGGGRTIWRSSGSVGAVIAADGCVDLILRNEEVFVAGPSTRWLETRADGDGGTLGLRLPPGEARNFLALDLSEITDQLAMLTDLLGRNAASRARKFLLGAQARPHAPDLAAAFGAQSSQVQSWASFVRGQARRGASPSLVAQSLDCSPRTFRRRMLEDFGYPYVTLVRIARAESARAFLLDGVGAAEAAALAGYADQPHLSREFRRLVGVSPAQFPGSSA